MTAVPIEPLLLAASEYLAGEGVLIPAESRHGLLDRAMDLAHRARALDDRLVIGLVGGTGVGKSTLINALAGQAISAATDLRPTTDHLLLYRHEDNLFSLAEAEEVHVHRAPGLERITLADFPDFDSIEPHHRRILADLFDRLDLLLWVTDPVKYADRAFYDWLALAPQAAQSSLFILNKVDEFEVRYAGRAGQVTAEVAADLKARIEEFAGFPDPVVLALSARRAFADPSGAADPGFASLLERIRELSDEKRRLAVKASNLSEMTTALFRELRAAADPDRAKEGLAKLTRASEAGQKDLTRMIRREAEALTTLLNRAWRAGLTAKARTKTPWPLDFYLFLWDRLTGLWRKNRSAAPAELPRPNLTPLMRRLAAWRAEIADALAAHPEAVRRLEDLQRGHDPGAMGDSAAGELLDGGAEAAESLARRRWIVRHHLLPLAVIGYPFWPYMAALAASALTGDPPPAPASVGVGWRDMLPLLEIVVGLYGLETIYYLYKLDRWADQALADLAVGWEKKMLDGFVARETSVLDRFAENLAGEIERVDRLTAFGNS